MLSERATLGVMYLVFVDNIGSEDETRKWTLKEITGIHGGN